MHHHIIQPFASPVNSIFKDENTRNKIRKHLTDINDEISDDDMRNIKTDMMEEFKPDITSENVGKKP